MRRAFVTNLPTPSVTAVLDADEARHLHQVMRLPAGSEVEAIDGSGVSVVARLEARGKTWELAFVRPGRGANDPAAVVYPLTLIMAVAKQEAMEWVVEKCTELGVRCLAPFFAVHSVVQPGRKSAAAFLTKWKRLVRESLKQCGRLTSMRVLAPAPDLSSALQGLQGETLYFCDEALAQEAEAPLLLELLSNDVTGRARALIIGPEGGWSDAERRVMEQHKAQSVGLGPLVLRSETAALFAVSVAVQQFQKLATTSR